MKKILFFLLFFIPATTLSAQIIADVHAGYTPMKGLVGVEIQYWRLSLSAAWWPTLNFTTYPIAGTYYFNTSYINLYGNGTKGIMRVEFNLGKMYWYSDNWGMKLKKLN